MNTVPLFQQEQRRGSEGEWEREPCRHMQPTAFAFRTTEARLRDAPSRNPSAAKRCPGRRPAARWAGSIRTFNRRRTALRWPARRRRERLIRPSLPPHPAGGHREHPPAGSSLSVSKIQKRARPTLQMSSNVLDAPSRVQLSPGTIAPALSLGCTMTLPATACPRPLEDAGRGARRGHCPWSEGPEECFCCS